MNISGRIPLIPPILVESALNVRIYISEDYEISYFWIKVGPNVTIVDTDLQDTGAE